MKAPHPSYYWHGLFGTVVPAHSYQHLPLRVRLDDGREISVHEKEVTYL